tara:strand:+ start:465 stop:761 length:297 start_codon:yes stop_codon:yes gene_type:complete
MKNYTLKQKLKAKYIIILEINGATYPSSYIRVVKDLQENTDLGELKISEAMQILNFTANKFNDLDFINDIFATTEKEFEQIQTDLKNYINQNTLKNEL